MQRYFISSDNILNDTIFIDGEDVHHLKNVMRASIGDQLICCDGQGLDFLAEITKMSSNVIECRSMGSSPSLGEPIIQVTVAQSLPKREKMEWILQKATEIGAVRFIPFVSERTIVKVDAHKKDQKTSRWTRIVKEAAEQAHRGMIPKVESLYTWKELLEKIKKVDLALMPYEKGRGGFTPLLTSKKVTELLLIVGPEGGFTEKEVSEAQERGAFPISLGPRILRTETASLVALSCILHHTGDLS